MAVIASLAHDWFGLNGSVTTNLIAGVIAFVFGYVVALRHMTCDHAWHCLRPGRVPVSGDVTHLCRKHAKEKGHTHL